MYKLHSLKLPIEMKIQIWFIRDLMKNQFKDMRRLFYDLYK